MSVDMDALIGRTLAQYQILERIGMGGTASVFKAYQPGLDRYVAVKVLSPFYAQQPGFQERFSREARSIARLSHPNILPVYDFGQADGYSYIVMRYVEAGTLHDCLGRPLALPFAVNVVSQVGMALEVAHSLGLIHRDVKPANILLDKGDWALLTDFGLARMVEESVRLTGTGVGIGTPAYMSPEQGQGHPVDARTDIYSLGVVLFEMLTGELPYRADTPLAVVVKHLTEPLPFPRSLNPDIPEPVERVILRSLAKDPEDRFQSAADMVQELQKAVECAEGEASASAVSPVPDISSQTGLESRGGTEPTAPGTHRAERSLTGRAATTVPGAVVARSIRGSSGMWMGIVIVAGVVGLVVVLAALVLASGTLSPLAGAMRDRLPGSVTTPAAATTAGHSVVETPASVVSADESDWPDWAALEDKGARPDLLPSRGALSGLVRDERGEPLRKVSIDVLSSASKDVVATVETGPNGAFEVVLPEGRYRIVFRDYDDPRRLVPEFHDDEKDLLAFDTATEFRVSPGRGISGIDMVLEKGFAVTGRLVDRTGRPVAGKAGGMVSRDAGVALVGPLGFTTRRDGTFKVIVPRGHYLLTFEGVLVRKEIFVRQEVTVEGDVDLGDIVYEASRIVRPEVVEAEHPLALMLIEREVGPGGHTEIFLDRLDGSELLQLTRSDVPRLPAGPEERPFGNITPAWSPDGEYIVFASNREAETRRDHHSLFIMRPDGSGTIRLTAGATDDRFPSWSPADGKRIAYSCGCEICLIHADGSEMRRLTSHGGRCERAYMQPVWSPDGEHIAFWTASTPTRPVELYVMRASVEEPRKVASLPPEVRFIELSWAPTGASLGVIGDAARGQVFVVDILTGELAPASKEDIGTWSVRFHPQWLEP